MFKIREKIQSIYLLVIIGILVMGTGCAELKKLRQENAELLQRSRAEEIPAPVITAANKVCVGCHRNHAPALVMEWERSRHAQHGIGCVDCHKANQGEIDAWLHIGTWVSALVTPKDCARCHPQEYEEFSRSHHASACEILASLDNVLAEKVAGLPGNIADAVNGCWQCHGSMLKFKRDSQGNILRTGRRLGFRERLFSGSDMCYLSYRQLYDSSGCV